MAGVDPKGCPEVVNLLLIAALCTGGYPVQIADFLGDAGAGALKGLVIESVNEHLRPLRQRRAELLNDPALEHDLSRSDSAPTRASWSGSRSSAEELTAPRGQPPGLTMRPWSVAACDHADRSGLDLRLRGRRADGRLLEVPRSGTSTNHPSAFRHPSSIASAGVSLCTINDDAADDPRRRIADRALDSSDLYGRMYTHDGEDGSL